MKREGLDVELYRGKLWIYPCSGYRRVYVRKALSGRVKYVSPFVSRRFRVINLRDFYLRCFVHKFPVLVGNRLRWLNTIFLSLDLDLLQSNKGLKS